MQGRDLDDVQRTRRAGLDRLGWALLLGGSGALLVTARLLTPAPSGVGTHTQLGLPPCGFLVLFGRPCPACGLTTAFVHLAHLAPLDSLRANPLGLPLFLLTIGLLLVSVRGLWRGDSPGWLLQGTFALRAALGLCLALLLVWVVRVVLG